jgi:hypothetical protein
MSKLYKIENHPDLVKDMDSKAVLNSNYAALLEYKRKQKVQEDVESLKSEMKDIKNMLSMILENLNK